MPRLRRLTTATALALALGTARPLAARAEDPPPAPKPVADPAKAALLAKAEALDARLAELWGKKKYAEATALAREALSTRETALGADHPDVAGALNNLAMVLYFQGAVAEARSLSERAITIFEKTLGKDDPLVATSLGNLAGILREQGDAAAARPLYERALAIREKVFGNDDPLVAASLNDVAQLLQTQGALADARPLFDRALAIREKALGKEHPLVAQSLNNLASLLQAQGARAKARPLYERALAINEKALGKNHPDVASNLNNLAELLRTEGAYANARPLYERALSINEATYGKDHPEVATSLNNLASLFFEEGAYAQARPLLERALAIREKSLGGDHPAVAQSLTSLAVLLHTQGARAEARPHFERALAINEKALGKNHPDVASNLNNLAELLRTEGAYANARSLYERALSINEATYGKDHPEVATSLNNLALLLCDEGIYAEARPLYERALAIYEKAFGHDHPDVALGLNNLASLLRAQGDYAGARSLDERALAIREKALGEGHPLVAASLNNLATDHRDFGNDREARPLIERALAINEMALGRDHPEVATCLNNLALLMEAEGAYAEARPLLDRALKIDEKAFGKEHPRVASSLGGLARLLQAQGAYADARPLFERALAIGEKALGTAHPIVAASLNDLATLLGEEGAYLEARPLYERALTATEVHVRAQLSALSGGQRRGFLRSTRYRLDNWVRFAPRVGLSGYPEVLRFRGIVGRSETAERILARRATVDDRRTMEVLRTAQRRAARLANDIPSSFQLEARAAWQTAYVEAGAERERLTLELSKRSASLRVALERLDLGPTDVQASLGTDAALVDLLRVGDRYFAWVVRASGEPVRIDVGAADKIDEACVAFVSAITDDGRVAEAGAALRALAWAPIEAKLGDGLARVVIVPDAALAAVPFAALPGNAPGRQLIDDLAISYVMSAQDLVPWKDAAPVGVGALLIGGVDYEHADVGTKEQPLPERPVVLASLDRAPRGGQFIPIPQTKVEAEGLRDRLGGNATTILLGSAATESRLRDAVKGKRFVHIATHGFAREDLLAGLYSRKIEQTWTSADMERQLAAGHDPMLLSGLAMAGANPREGAGGDDGILTALEASYLDLDGVDLVTLSACETAKGTAESGEGVQGLVSAFQMAGARRIVASLWRVDDEGTRRLMEGLYERMLRKENPLSPSDALRESAIALRDFKDPDGKTRFAAPRYWAAFVAYGK